MSNQQQQQSGHWIDTRGTLKNILNQGISTLHAIGELLDNSISAGATIIKIYLNPDTNKLIVSDNGCGMTREELKVAATFNKRSLASSKHGRFGAGETHAGVQLTQLEGSVRTVSRKSGRDALSQLDINFPDVIESGERVICPHGIEEDVHHRSWDVHAVDKDGSGTLKEYECNKDIISELITKINSQNINNSLRYSLGTIYFNYLNGGGKICLNIAGNADAICIIPIDRLRLDSAEDKIKYELEIYRNPLTGEVRAYFTEDNTAPEDTSGVDWDSCHENGTLSVNTIAQMKLYLESRELKKSGTKQELANRISKDLERGATEEGYYTQKEKKFEKGTPPDEIVRIGSVALECVYRSPTDWFSKQRDELEAIGIYVPDVGADGIEELRRVLGGTDIQRNGKIITSIQAKKTTMSRGVYPFTENSRSSVKFYLDLATSDDEYTLDNVFNIQVNKSRIDTSLINESVWSTLEKLSLNFAMSCYKKYGETVVANTAVNSVVSPIGNVDAMELQVVAGNGSEIAQAIVVSEQREIERGIRSSEEELAVMLPPVTDVKTPPHILVPSYTRDISKTPRDLLVIIKEFRSKYTDEQLDSAIRNAGNTVYPGITKKCRELREIIELVDGMI